MGTGSVGPRRDKKGKKNTSSLISNLYEYFNKKIRGGGPGGGQKQKNRTSFFSLLSSG